MMGSLPIARPTIEGAHQDLSFMYARLDELLIKQEFSDRHFVEIAAILDNVSYLFLYLESNSPHVDFTQLLPWKERFFNDDELDGRLMAVLRGLSCSEKDLEQSRKAYIGFLGAKRCAKSTLETERIADARFRAKDILGGITSDLKRLLDSLNVGVGGSRPDAAFYALASRTKKVVTRRKLHDVWRRVRDQKLDDLVDVIDEIAKARWTAARRQGVPSVAFRTFQRCGVAIDQADAFLQAYLSRAVESQIELCRLIGGKRAPGGASMDDFGYYLLRHYGPDKMPMLPLDGCLRFAFGTAGRILGLTFERLEDDGERIIRVDVLKEGRHTGRIHFDLWAEEHRDKGPNLTRGLRNRTAWKDVEQVPVAHVSCRFRRMKDGREALNFQNVHSLFHEFGHALNHLFIKRRMPNQSGLEYLPLERLEIFSMWFEKWIFHPEFLAYVEGEDADPSGLALAQEIKMLEYRRTHLDRAVTSAIDLLIHYRPDLGVREAFHILDDRFGIDDFCDLGAILPSFTWPMIQSNPGAYFAYLWGAARSAELFSPFRTFSLEETAEPHTTWSALAECFDFDQPSTLPDVESGFTFYGG
jgi:oligopeptidase A